LSLGLHMGHNVALAKLSLAGIAMAKRNKREATKYLQEAKRADKNKLLADQIKMMKDQMGMMDRQQIRYRSLLYSWRRQVSFQKTACIFTVFKDYCHDLDSGGFG